jgi:hypothetical protein
VLIDVQYTILSSLKQRIPKKFKGRNIYIN